MKEKRTSLWVPRAEESVHGGGEAPAHSATAAPGGALQSVLWGHVLSGRALEEWAELLPNYGWGVPAFTFYFSVWEFHLKFCLKKALTATTLQKPLTWSN